MKKKIKPSPYSTYCNKNVINRRTIQHYQSTNAHVFDNMTENFNLKKHTGLIQIDIEKAFNSVTPKFVIYK